MEKIELQASPREVMGKKVRFLRRQGIVPLHIFGHGIASLALQCDIAQVQEVLSQAGKTKIINVKLEKSKTPRNVVVREIQRNPMTGGLLHVDLYQVNMTEKIHVEVPIHLVGEAPALKHRENMLEQELHSLNIECLPDKIPASIELDISSLAEAEQSIQVGDITLDEGVAVLNDPEHAVVKISSRPAERVEEAAEAEEAPEVTTLAEEETSENQE
jgi:large subunit ribosomal protein L25